MPTLALNDASRSAAAPVQRSRPAPAIIVALFCGYLSVGLPLPVVSLFVHDVLGFGNPTVGLTIGLQFLATVLTRGHAGRITDTRGGKQAALQGAAIGAFGSLLYLVAAVPSLSASTSLGFVIAARLANGLGESLFVTGCVSWSIASVGQQRAGMSMSWTGIAMFAALAVGAPIGMAIYRLAGFGMVIGACIAAPLAAVSIAWRAVAYASPAGRRLPFHRVIGRIWREGIGLMLSGIGLAALNAFASLYFAARGWTHAGVVMTGFGLGFIVVRLVLGHLPDRIGGYRVAFLSLVVEAVGQALLWGAPREIVALAGSLVTGLGCALIFPALGVEALKRVQPASRGSAMGAFVAFLDVAYGLAGPATGVVAGQFGYAAVYLLGAAGAGLGAVLVLVSGRSAV